MDNRMELDFPVFSYRVYIIMTDNIARSRDERKGILGALEKPLSETVDGLHSFNKLEHDSYIFITPASTTGTITHELFHALWRMFKFVGAKLENETFAYHLSYGLDTILEWISNNKDNG